MKKTILIVSLLALSFSMSFLSASPGNYDDLKAFMASTNVAMDELVVEMEAAKDAKSIAAAISKMNNKFMAMLPGLKKLYEKYPNLDELTEKNVPEELKAEVEKGKVNQTKMQSFGPKIMQHGSDPAVSKALQEMQQCSMEMAKLKPKKEKAPEAAAPATEKKE